MKPPSTPRPTRPICKALWCIENTKPGRTPRKQHFRQREMRHPSSSITIRCILQREWRDAAQTLTGRLGPRGMPAVHTSCCCGLVSARCRRGTRGINDQSRTGEMSWRELTLCGADRWICIRHPLCGTEPGDSCHKCFIPGADLVILAYSVVTRMLVPSDALCYLHKVKSPIGLGYVSTSVATLRFSRPLIFQLRDLVRP